METEAMLLDTLKDWRYLQRSIARLRNTLDEKTYKVTTDYSDVKAFSSGLSNSKVENYCLARLETEAKIDDIQQKLDLCRTAYQRAALSQEEKKTILYTVAGKSLVQLARELGMAQARIYRIRDRAVRKMCTEIQNEVKC